MTTSKRYKKKLDRTNYLMVNKFEVFKCGSRNEQYLNR